ncbi:MAG: insulinase family protein [Bacteroidetes bacterium]|nr:insulinase family protein [Bacteroidota bacterium]
MRSYSHFSLSKLLAAASLVLAVSLNTNAQDLNAKLPTDPKVIKGKLANGLTYYIRPNSKPEKKVELRLMVNAGSILEDDDQQGLAHFMEHMNFNGTKNFEKNQLVEYLQSIGVEFGADLNAYTGFDETVYILPIPTDKPGNLDKGFQIIEDWAHAALLTDKDIDGERGVVLEESRLGKGADDRMSKKYLPKLLNGSHYKDRLPIGKDEILKSFKYDVIRRFHHDWYRPDLQAVAIVGDIDEATARAYLKKHFEGLKNPTGERPRKAFEVPNRTKSEGMVLTDKEATNYSIDLVFTTNKHHDEVTVGDYRNSIVRGLVSTMWNRRLRDLTRSANPPFTYAYVSYGGGWARGYEGLSASAGFGAGEQEKALNALTAELLRAQKFGFTASELDLAKKEMMSSIEKMYNERNTTESGRLVEEYIRNFLENEPIPGIENEFNYYKQLMPGITLDETNKLVNTWMSNMNVFSLLTGPEQGPKLPTDAELVAMTDKGFKQEVKPMEEKKVSSELLATRPTPGKVVSKTEDKEFGSTTLTLSNGIKVTIKTTDFKADEILMKGVKKGGSNNYGVEDKYNVQFAAGVVGAMGFGNFTPTDLEKAMAGKTAKLSAGIGGITNVVNGSSSVKDFETMLQLAYLKLTQPRKDEALFNAYKTKQKTQLQFAFSNPQTAFIDTLYRYIFKGQPLAPMAVPRPEFYDAINLDRALSIYQQELAFADGYEFYIVGNITVDQATPLVEQYLGALKSMNTTPSFKDNGVRIVKGASTFKYYKGKEKQSMILGIYSGEQPYTEDLDLRAQALAEVLNIRVIEVLREKMGGMYSGGFNCQVERDPYPHYMLQMYVPCGPENVDKLVKAASDIISDLKKNGPNATEMEKVKTTWHEQNRDQKKENSYWVENMIDIMFNKKERANFFGWDAWVDKLTAADIKTTANLLFDGKNEVTAELFPEEEAKN